MAVRNPAPWQMLQATAPVTIQARTWDQPTRAFQARPVTIQPGAVVQVINPADAPRWTVPADGYLVSFDNEEMDDRGLITKADLRNFIRW